MTIESTPNLVARPPVVYLCSIAGGLLLHLVWPVAVVPGDAEGPLGGLLILAAVALFAISVREFRRSATPIRATRPPTAVVTTGPYRLSRNPIYLSFTLFQLGVAVWANSAWLLGTLVPTLGLMSRGVIAREEDYLAQRFGEPYLAYKASVRRWL